jgi:hypothetical protein
MKPPLRIFPKLLSRHFDFFKAQGKGSKLFEKRGISALNARRKKHSKQQRHFRKEVNCFYQNACTSSPESLMVNHNSFTARSVMTS